MKIAISFPGVHRKGGVERVAFECARFLANRGHAVHILAQQWEVISSRNVTYHAVDGGGPSWTRGTRYFHASSAILNRIDYDVLNTHGCVCPTGGVQWVQSVHAAWLDRAKHFRPSLSVSRIKQLLNPVHKRLLNLERLHFSERRYRRIIATTPEVVADLHKFYQVPQSDVTIVPNGFNSEEFNPVRRFTRRAELRQKYGLNSDHIGLLFVANELERKGYPVLLKALQILNDPRLRLFVIGRASVKLVRSMALKGRVEKSVTALGSSDDVAGMHALADLFVLPTQYEAFALAILESLGSGLPVLTTNIPGARDAIRPGRNGILVNDPLDAEELAEAMRPLLDQTVLHRLSESTPDTVKDFHWESILDRYLSVLRESIDAPR